MGKKTILITLAFFGLIAWNVYEISILHKNIRQVRKEAWFTCQDRLDTDITDIKECLEHLEDRLDAYNIPTLPDYPNGYPIWEKKEVKSDPFIEYMIDQCL